MRCHFTPMRMATRYFKMWRRSSGRCGDSRSLASSPLVIFKGAASVENHLWFLEMLNMDSVRSSNSIPKYKPKGTGSWTRCGGARL